MSPHGRRAVSIVAAASLGVALGAAPGSAADPRSLQSFDGTTITFYWFPAVGLAEGQRAPTVLQGPGFGGKAQSNPDATNTGAVPAVGDLRRAGYNVLTWNPRGISPSGGQAQLDNPDIEGRDVSALITWVADQPEAQLDAAGDPRLGMTGGSYGGGIQFSTAAIDHRIDAIVPVIAWNSLATSLYKADTIKTAWINALMAGATQPGNTFSPSILKGRKQASKGMTFSPDVIEFAHAAGPDRVLSQIQAPALIMQGTIDNLFPPSEAVANYRALTAAGVPTKMIWYCGGHGWCRTPGVDESLPRQQTWLWLQRYLKSDTSVDTGPGFTWIDQRGTYRSAAAYPAAGKGALRATGSGRLTLAKKGGSGPYTGDLPSSVSPLVGLFLRAALPTPAKRAVEVTVRAKRPAVIVGAPKLRLTYKGKARNPDVRVLAQLVDNRTDQVLGHQITPVALRLDGKKHRMTVPLEEVGASLRKGQRLTLQVVAQSSMYNVFPKGGSVRFQRVAVALPTVTGN
ncbi:MAG TPA: CocE/NonD family hydrolase [Actinomycetota bacterium]|nr:CocE/NonD family hydrolase [Actinomycetota bacterium]